MRCQAGRAPHRLQRIAVASQKIAPKLAPTKASLRVHALWRRR